MSPGRDRLTRRDMLWLVGLSVLFYLVPIWHNRPLSTHESIHCQNVREMLAGGDWIVPTFGGRPWLERPPAPHWMTALGVLLTGRPDAEWSYRLGSSVAGTMTLLLVAWMAGLWFGRRAGVLSGVVLMTMYEFTRYSLGPEADIYLCLIVTAALALFVKLEFDTPDQRRGFLAGRPMTMLAFFVVLGLTNLAKGLFFGTIMVLVPVGLFLIGRGSWSHLRRYVWLWGWLAFAAAGSAWALAAWLRYPDIVDLWFSDYGGRMNQGYMKEPVWYYLPQLLLCLAPWTLFALHGLGRAFGQAWRDRSGPERFLACWALGTLAWLSVPQGKHHHYLLHGLAPWAVLTSLSVLRAWEAVQRVTAKRWTWTAGRLRGAMIGGLVGLIVLTWVVELVPPVLRARYDADLAFTRQVRQVRSTDVPLYVLNDVHPLDSSWMMFYLPEASGFLHNVTYLLDSTITQPTIEVLARGQATPLLEMFGRVEVLARSARSRAGETGPECWQLHRLTFRPDLRRTAAERISPMQATGRALGPFLSPPPPRPGLARQD